MRAELHSITSFDSHVDLDGFRPLDEAFEVMVEYVVAYQADGHDVEEVYRALVTSPAWFTRELEGDPRPVSGRYRLIADAWHAGEIRKTLERLVATCGADDWRDLRAKLRTIGRPADDY